MRVAQLITYGAGSLGVVAIVVAEVVGGSEGWLGGDLGEEAVGEGGGRGRMALLAAAFGRWVGRGVGLGAEGGLIVEGVVVGIRGVALSSFPDAEEVLSDRGLALRPEHRRYLPEHLSTARVEILKVRV